MMYFGKFSYCLASFSISLFAGVAVCTAVDTHAAEAPLGYRDLFADTWVAQDALGRNMPSAQLVLHPAFDKQ
jgi:hypothetical protein